MLHPKTRDIVKRIIYYFVALSMLMTASCSSPKNDGRVYLADYLTDEMLGEDVEPAIRAALEACGGGNCTLVLPADTLPVRRDFCFGKYLKTSNNDPGDKRIAFDLEGMENLLIEGNGATLLFSGFVSPFYLKGVRNVTVKDLNIDYTRTFHSEGTIMAVGKDCVTVHFPDEYRVGLESGILVFRDVDGTKYPYGNLLEFDAEKKEVAHYVHDYWIWGAGLQAEALSDGNYKVYVKDIDATPGNVLVFGAASRLNPAFTVDESSDILIKNVNIFHCGGMGVIAQRTKDIELDSVNVVPSGDRVISITADASHFINCKGSVRIIDCVFTNQKDDATNIHGWYSIARKKTADNELLLWSNYGMDFARPGMRMELVNHNTMMTYDTLEVQSVSKYNDDLSLVSFTEPISECFEENDALADADSNPDVLIEGCYFANNRARGLLIGSRGHVVIRNNRFHVPGTAILFEGDGNYWYEQSGVRDVTICDNVFENCLYGSSSWGKAYIAVGSGIPQRNGSRYHHNIIIEGNTFNTYDPRILYLYCVDGVTYKDNKVVMNNDYAFSRPGESFTICDCDNVNITE